jgi:hypothetical protein
MEHSPDLSRYRAETIVVEPLDHMAPAVNEAYGELIASGDHLANLSIQRRQLVRQSGSRAEQLRTDFLDARARYSTAFQSTADLYITNMRVQGAGHRQIRQAVLPYIVGLHHQLTAKETSLLEDPSNKAPRLSPLLNQLHAHTSARASADNARLKRRTEDLVASNHTPETAVIMVGRYFDTLLSDRIESDQNSTTKRARSSAVLGAVATVAASKLRRDKRKAQATP